MSSTLSATRLTASVKTNLTGGASVIQAVLNHAVSVSPATGTATGGVDVAYSAPFTVTNTSTATVLDVTTLTDPIGGAVSMVRVNAILISNSSTTAANVLLVGGGSNPLVTGERYSVHPNGGAVFVVAPTPGFASGTSAKNITINAAAGTNVAGQLTLIGRSTS